MIRFTDLWPNPPNNPHYCPSFSRELFSVQKSRPLQLPRAYYSRVLTRTFFHLLCSLALYCAPAALAAADYDADPINYTSARPDNPVSRFWSQLQKNPDKLTYSQPHGYLPSLLSNLNIPHSSQVLVFSKTSLQRQRISPATPRAIYFNDDTYVGWCRNGDFIEIATADPKLGAVFYTLDQEPRGRPQLVRQTDTCLQCHDSPMTRQVPGLLVRSVFTDSTGMPIFRAGTFLTTHESPLKERWGGWYVTGKHGEQKHLGNQLFEDEERGPKPISREPALNLLSLADRFDTASYLTPHSDIVALMILEHQAEMHNRIARASYQTRFALRDERIMNEALGQPPGTRSDSTTSRIQAACEPLVKYMLFNKEAPLTAPLDGTSKFADEFAARGPKDRRGRSLRDLDCHKRLLRYPCSYLIYSESFNALPPEAKQYLYARLWEVLSGADKSEDFSHLSQEDRTAILVILRDTKKDLPDNWR